MACPYCHHPERMHTVGVDRRTGDESPWCHACEDRCPPELTTTSAAP